MSQTAPGAKVWLGGREDGFLTPLPPPLVEPLGIANALLWDLLGLSFLL